MYFTLKRVSGQFSYFMLMYFGHVDTCLHVLCHCAGPLRFSEVLQSVIEALLDLPPTYLKIHFFCNYSSKRYHLYTHINTN